MRYPDENTARFDQQFLETEYERNVRLKRAYRKRKDEENVVPSNVVDVAIEQPSGS